MSVLVCNYSKGKGTSTTSSSQEQSYLGEWQQNHFDAVHDDDAAADDDDHSHYTNWARQSWSKVIGIQVFIEEVEGGYRHVVLVIPGGACFMLMC
jgi:hypothetical protein